MNLIRKRSLIGVTLLLLALPLSAWSIDTVELATGATAQGTIKSYTGESVVIDVKVGTRTIQRTYPKSRVRAIIVNGMRIDVRSGSTTPVSPGGVTERSREEILAEIDRLGKTPPHWFESTPLSYPKTLDLTWPMPAPKGWDSSRNVGQFLWDRINPNAKKWHEGVRFMHHILSVSKDKGVQKRAMRSLGSMYHNLLQDHARSAFWFRQSGLENELSDAPQIGVFLADCYWKLGSKQMALEVLAKMPRKPYLAIKLLGDLGETDTAVNLAEAFAKSGQASTSFLYAGDACRVAGRLTDAEKYYRKAIAGIPKNEADKPHPRRDKSRAEASIAAIRFYSLDPKNVRDGKYTAESIGYEAPVVVEVVVASGMIKSVTVTRHREKQYYSSLTDTPRKILARQGVAGIDATSSATITSEAIINATAKALANGMK
ncbi:MAG: FMN-binding protein [Planctomycetota bacterium]|nr:FMN-binding protein [Planctomycetota bacterium]